MTARPRTVSDADILEATAEAIGDVGPRRFVLADVAGRLGVSNAALVQRFGSKRGLLLALAERAPALTAEPFEAALARSDSPLEALLGVLVGGGGFASTPEQMANHLAFLQMDLEDAEFRRHALAQAEAFRRGIRSLLEAAMAAGELDPCDTERLARAIQVAFNGSLLTWAIRRTGSAGSAVEEDVRSVLEPWARREPRPGGDRDRRFRLAPASTGSGAQGAMDPEIVVERFVRAINAHDVPTLAGLASADHLFVDSLGEELRGRERLGSAWRAYLAMVPDYRIRIRERLSAGSRVVLLGTAEGSYAPEGEVDPAGRWRTPAAWEAVVRDLRVAEWRVYADNEPLRGEPVGGQRTVDPAWPRLRR